MKAPSAQAPRPTWASARKDMVGTSLGSSRLWFTIAEGILTEVYYPRIDIPQIRDLGFIIADDQGFWVELRRLGSYEVKLAAPGVPAVEIIHKHPRFTFTLNICPSQQRDVLLLQFKLEGDQNLKPYALLGARLGGCADDNLAFVSSHGGRTVLWGEQGPFGLALAAIDDKGREAWRRCSVGCIEASDGWQDFNANGKMIWQYDIAGPAPVAMMGELPPQATLALGFGTSKEAAATLSVSALMGDFSKAWEAQCKAWETWGSHSSQPPLPGDLNAMFALSATVLKVHQDRTFCGAAVASLSVPWGDSSESRGGYHLVWSRDLVETAGALVAMENYDEARDVLRYLIATQQENGHWFQNQWLGGTAFWDGVQLDEAAFPVLLASTLQAHGALDGIPVEDMITRALSFVAREGPASDQDRWEEDAGLNTFTLSIAISALVEGSRFLDPKARDLALRVADCWNSHLEDWTYVQNTSLAAEVGVQGHYIRTGPADVLTGERSQSEVLLIKNLADDPALPANVQVATDFLQLVRSGLRRADDPAILDSIKVIDHFLKVTTPSGPVWHRYNDDGYGEHDDGSAFDGTGRGRAWPLLTGERGHYALAAGEDVMPYLKAMQAMANPQGLIPEQVWDSAEILDCGLKAGKPSGSAMPLVWAHSEFIKLCCSRALGHPVDRPAATWARYHGVRPEPDFEIWGPSFRPTTLRFGKNLTIMLKEPALVHWGINGWKNASDVQTDETGLGVFIVDLPVQHLKVGETLQFSLKRSATGVWEGQDYEMMVVE